MFKAMRSIGESIPITTHNPKKMSSLLSLLLVLLTTTTTTITNASPPPPPNARCPNDKFGIEALLYQNTTIGAPKILQPTLTAWGQTLITTYSLDKFYTDIFMGISQDAGTSWSRFTVAN